ncbi:helix-turn-helix domain-containing protein [Pseudomonas fluorescens]|nr:helix-turn-helix domain-containing protein [Pseudomonas fluorescens]
MLNPFYSYVGTTTGRGRYPAFAMDIIEGVARLDWYGQKHRNIPLSVYKLCVILESLPVITKDTIQDLFHYRDKQAQRYYNAIELIVPRMMEARPTKLIDLMSGVEVSSLRESEWDDIDDVCQPTPEELAKLHHDLRTFTEYGSEAFYNAYWGFDSDEQYARKDYTLEDAQKHSRELRANPKKAVVLSLLNGGLNVSEVQKQTGVSRPTITKWRDEKKAA